jgi:hypothetical protein
LTTALPALSTCPPEGSVVHQAESRPCIELVPCVNLAAAFEGATPIAGGRAERRGTRR